MWTSGHYGQITNVLRQPKPIDGTFLQVKAPQFWLPKVSRLRGGTPNSMTPAKQGERIPI